MSANPVIEATQLGKRYTVAAASQHHDSFRELVTSRARALVRGRSDGGQEGQRSFWALRDASFEVRAGENVGLIGLNGAGKSTLLKMLSRITEPTTGSARIQGRLSTLLEVGTGFHWELTGRENIYLYGSILGMSRAEIGRKYETIVEFSGIGAMIDTPVKRYSSGMYVRLAFAVAAHVEPDILLLDEVLAVGDLAFQRKCMEFAKRLQRERRATILLVSHNMASIKAMCNRVIYLHQGKIRFEGSVDEGVRQYLDDCHSERPEPHQHLAGEQSIVVTEIALSDERGAASAVFDHGERMRLRIRYEVRREVNDPNFIVAFVRSDGIACCNYSSETDGIRMGRVGDSGTLELLTPPLKLVAELYDVRILIREHNFEGIISTLIGPRFHIRHNLFDMNFGVFHESAEWKSCPLVSTTPLRNHASNKVLRQQQ